MIKNEHNIAFYAECFPELIQDLIDDIMDNFDFEKVHTTMKALNWSWRGEGVPEVSEIRKEARNILKTTIKEAVGEGSNEMTISCGGFETHMYVCDYDEDDTASEQIQLVLRFVVESWGDV